MSGTTRKQRIYNFNMNLEETYCFVNFNNYMFAYCSTVKLPREKRIIVLKEVQLNRRN